MSSKVFEIRREIFHILVGILFILIIMFFSYAQTFLFIVLILGGFLSFLSTQIKIPIISNFLCSFEREYNKKFPGRGVIFFFIGSLLSLQLFERNVALAAILILTFSDPISHFIGANFGRTALFNKRKYIEGTIVGILIGTFFASFFVHPAIAFLGAGIAMFLECAGIAMAQQTVDDNLFIPLVAGTVMHLVSLRLGI